MISARNWKLAGVGLLALAIGAGILAGGWTAVNRPDRLGPGLRSFFELGQATLARSFLCAMIFLSSQLALLMWWLRAQSLQDFNGRYRGWLFCAACGFLAAFAVATGAPDALSRTIDWLWPVAFWNKSRLTWMVPSAVCGLGLARFLHVEMRGCRASLACMWLAFLLACASAGLMLTGSSALSTLSPLTARMVQCGIAMLAGVCLFMSLVFLASHVIYRSVEPPPGRPSRLLQWVRRIRISLPRRRTAESSGGSGAATASSRRQRRTGTTARAARRSEPAAADPGPAGSTPKANSVPAASAAPAAESRTQTRDAQTGGAAAARSSSNGGPSAGKEPAVGSTANESAQRHDPFGGMSRRERKLIKKQMRADAQVGARSA